MRSLAAAVPALYPSGFLIEMFVDQRQRDTFSVHRTANFQYPVTFSRCLIQNDVNSDNDELVVSYCLRRDVLRQFCMCCAYSGCLCLWCGVLL